MLIASGMADHAEAIISVVDVGPSLNKDHRGLEAAAEAGAAVTAAALMPQTGG